ncbi:MAG TPA: formate dehydrogenase accessory sulfurtransferase FdhD [Gaiellales bacterium]
MADIEITDEVSVTDLAPLRGPSAPLRVLEVDGETSRRRRDRLATEEPLEIRASGPGQPTVRVAVTMRTPGHDFELAAGFLYTEGLIAARHAFSQIRYCTDVGVEQHLNVVTVDMREHFDASHMQRNFFASSSCGVCGKASIDQLAVACTPIALGLTVTRQTIVSLPARLRAEQRVFESTGGLHATGLFRQDGEPIVVREDVGRHNAMDKLVGSQLLTGELPLSSSIALVSGRASFELVQKAAVAGIPVMCAVSAPSTLAVETARRLGVTLIGFLRGERFNVYSHPERIEL